MDRPARFGTSLGLIIGQLDLVVILGNMQDLSEECLTGLLESTHQGFMESHVFKRKTNMFKL